VACRRWTGEAPQQDKLLLAEAGDVGEGLRSSERSQQCQQQHLVERINHLGLLPGVGQTLK
jgi:hypothetical protein